jgi:hypothetical protein
MRFRDTLIDDLNAISPAKRALAFTLATLGGLAAWQVPTLWPSYILPGVSPACVLIAAAAAMCSWRSWPWTCWSLPVSSLSDRSVRSGTARSALGHCAPLSLDQGDTSTGNSGLREEYGSAQAQLLSANVFGLRLRPRNAAYKLAARALTHTSQKALGTEARSRRGSSASGTRPTADVRAASPG